MLHDFVALFASVLRFCSLDDVIVLSARRLRLFFPSCSRKHNSRRACLLFSLSFPVVGRDMNGGGVCVLDCIQQYCCATRNNRCLVWSETPPRACAPSSSCQLSTTQLLCMSLAAGPDENLFSRSLTLFFCHFILSGGGRSTYCHLECCLAKTQLRCTFYSTWRLLLVPALSVWMSKWPHPHSPALPFLSC